MKQIPISQFKKMKLEAITEPICITKYGKEVLVYMPRDLYTALYSQIQAFVPCNTIADGTKGMVRGE